MVAQMERSAEYADKQSVGRKSRKRFLAVFAVVIALILAGVGIWTLTDDATSQSEEDIQALLDEYLEAWEVRDEAAVRSVTSEDFVLNEYVYASTPSGTSLEFHVIDDIDGVVAVGFTYNWTAEQLGSLQMTGDGPWVVSVEENWQNSVSLLEGQANYTVIEVDGELEIVNHYWAGFMVPVDG